MLIETTQKFVVDTEVAAKDMIEEYRTNASSKGYTIKKASYTRKDKKSKGEIIDTRFLVEVVQTFGDIWGE